MEFEVNWFIQIKAHKDIAHFETAYVVKLHRIARLAPTQSVSDHSFCCIYPSSIVYPITFCDMLSFPKNYFI